MTKAILSAVLATLLIAGTAMAQDEEEITFREALTEYTVATALVDAAFEEASLNGYEGLSMQALTDEVGAALDTWQSLVVESCASQWYTVPCRPALVGAQFQTQWTTLDPSQAPCGLYPSFAISDRYLHTIGQ